ncbi:hypothetical protein GCM10022243_04000 [Saccharothrix violaceirubra]|uniref:Uncharacterized protein n=1 Tax=Saccharothrix violaceirubra TaxID=413306 RepID=A0A7W7WT85_9PSEU|nr:hypothetical protein [Saccharothrix violaceirubra]MBB4962809.1 hypothetical protein [Saccharothrix violaceirubra]
MWLCRESDDLVARRACLTAVVRTVLDLGVVRLSLESAQHQDARDRRTIAAVVGKAADFGYDHFRSSEEPLLWAADALAWCFGAGGEWRRRVEPFVDEVFHLDAP